MSIEFLGPFNMSQWYKNADIKKKPSLLDTYRQLLKMTLRYAVDRLNQKAIYSNMISFCAKVLGTVCGLLMKSSSLLTILHSNLLF